MSSLRIDRNFDEASAARDDLLKVFDGIIIEPHDVSETRQQRSGEEPCARGCADERKWFECQLNGRRVGTIARHDVDLEGFDRGIEALFDGRREAMDFINEEHVASFELCQKSGECAFVLDRRTARGVQRDAHLARDDMGERGFTETRRSTKKRVINGFTSTLRSLDKDLQVLTVFVLTDVFVQ